MKIKKNEIFFWLGVILFLLKSWIGSSFILNKFSGFDSILLLLSYFCFIINIILNSTSEKLVVLRKIFYIIVNPELLHIKFLHIQLFLV